jgi:NaMN:DMB phosphoribosyltransferase
MAKRSTRKGKTRFTMWIDANTLERLEALQGKTGKGSVAEVVREAMTVYGEMVTAHERGVRLFFEDRKSGEKGRVWLVPGGSPFDAS